MLSTLQNGVQMGAQGEWCGEGEKPILYLNIFSRRDVKDWCGIYAQCLADVKSKPGRPMQSLGQVELLAGRLNKKITKFNFRRWENDLSSIGP